MRLFLKSIGLSLQYLTQTPPQITNFRSLYNACALSARPTNMRLASSKLLLLCLAAAATLAGAAAGNTTQACTPSEVGFGDSQGPPCSSCCAALQQLPLAEWSEERAAPTTFPLPWGQGKLKPY